MLKRVCIYGFVVAAIFAVTLPRLATLQRPLNLLL